MGICCHCGNRFPETRATRKYCTSRCRTNACLDRKVRRIRAADVEELHAMLDAEVVTAEVLRERLRAILRPEARPIPLVDGRVVIPTLD